MEKHLDKCLDDICQVAGVTGCILADNQGLCLGVKGKASGNSSGMITALACQAARLEKNENPPVILLENDSRQCLIQKTGNVTAAIYKTVKT